MGILDTENLIKKLDPEGMLQSINDLPDQIESAWKDLQSLIIPAHYLKCNKVLILGMGGSAIGGELVSTLALNYSRAPIFVQRDYGLPSFVDSNTLVIAVSYSGNTEETLDAFEKAGEKSAKLITISTGGKIGVLSSKYRAPIFKINYGAQPRAALGYLFTALLYILNKLDLYALGENEISESVHVLRQYQKIIGLQSPTSQNPAKKLAQKLSDKIPLIMGAGPMSTVARRWKTQINENSKELAIYEVFPELCHNVIVGLDFPKKLSDKIFLISLDSEFDHPRNRLRQSIVQQIFRKKGIGFEVVNMEKPGSPLIEMLEMIMLGDYVSFYLAMINEIDPTPVEMIKFLKDKLAENK